MSKSGQPLARYFPDVVAGLHDLAARRFVIDGEIIVTENRTLSFDAFSNAFTKLLRWRPE